MNRLANVHRRWVDGEIEGEELLSSFQAQSVGAALKLPTGDYSCYLYHVIFRCFRVG